MLHTSSALVVSVGAMLLMWRVDCEERINLVHSTDCRCLEIELRLPDLTVGPNRGARQVCFSFSQPQFSSENDTTCEAYEISDRQKCNPGLGLRPASFLDETLECVPYKARVYYRSKQQWKAERGGD